MKKIKLLPSIIMLALCLAVLGIGVYSATTGSNTISGTLTVDSAGYEVDIAVYEYTGNTTSTGSVRIDHSLATASQMYGKPLGSVTGSRAGKPITLSGIAFNSDTANTFYDVDMIDLVIAVTNKSSEDVGIYFWDGYGTKPTQVTASDLGNEGHVLYGHKSLNATDGTHNNIADAEYSFYHHLPGYYTMTGTAGTDNTYKYGDYSDTGSGVGDKRYYTEFMHVYLRLKEAGFTPETLTINLSMALNVEKYVPNFESTDAGEPSSYSASTFVKVAKGVTDRLDFSSNSTITHIVQSYNFDCDSTYNCYNRTGLLAYSIPISVKSVAVSSFWSDGFVNCSGLGSIIIPNSITSIGISAFGCCYGLTHVVVPEGVSLETMSNFASCTGLISAIIRGSSSLPVSLFDTANTLRYVKLVGVTGIDGSAFLDCPSLERIDFQGTLSSPYELPSISSHHWKFNGETVTTIAAGIAGQGTYLCIAD